MENEKVIAYIKNDIKALKERPLYFLTNKMIEKEMSEDYRFKKIIDANLDMAFQTGIISCEEFCELSRELFDIWLYRLNHLLIYEEERA